MGKRNRFEYIVKNDKGNAVYKGKIQEIANHFNVVQNDVYMCWKYKKRLLKIYILERKEVNPYVPKNKYEKAFYKACAFLNGIDGLTARQWKERCLKDD